MSRVLIEAAALGVPIAAMDTGGTRDILHIRRDGAAVDHGRGRSPADLARLADDAGCASSLGAAAASTFAPASTRAVDRRTDRARVPVAARAASRLMPTAAPMRVAVVARAVMPLHGVGGLERSVHDLVRHLAARRCRRHTDYAAARGRRTGDRARSVRVASHHPFAPRAVRHVSVRESARHHGARSQHGVSDLRPCAPADWRARSCAGRASISSTVSARACSGTRWRRPPRAGAARVQSAGARGIRRDAPPRSRSSSASGTRPLRRPCASAAARADGVIATDASLEADRRAAPRIPRPGGCARFPTASIWSPSRRYGRPGRRTPAFGERSGIGRGRTVLLSVGRLEHNKGFDVLAARAGTRVAHGRRPGR